METHEVKTAKTPVKDFFLRAIAVLGLIAILLLGAWGIIQLAFAIPSVFSNLGGAFSSTSAPASTSSAKEAVTVSIPATIGSGQTLTVSWMHSNADTSGQYSYALSYACQSGLSVKAPLPTGNYQAVPCNTLFDYVNASEHMDLVPSVSGASQPLAITVTATKLSTGAVTAQGTATTNVTAGAAAKTTTAKPAATKPAAKYYPAATRATNLYGYGDLAVHFTSVAPSYTTTVIKFVIENDGTNIVPAGWTFNATLPIKGSYTFGSQPQQALYPGDKIAYTLSFAGANQTSSGYTSAGYVCNGYSCTNNNYGYQTATITITADPQNRVPEYNKGNNIAQTTIPLY
jgi:hypothetical protein